MSHPPQPPEQNPFQSPASSEAAIVPVRRGRSARSYDFVQLAFQFKLFGAIGLLFAVLTLLAVPWLGAALFLGGAAFVATGYGLGAYKPWGWYAAAALVVPMLGAATLLAVLFAVVYVGPMWRLASLAVVLMTPLYCYYIAWTLFSRSGRARYEASCRAQAAIKADPGSIAARMQRRR